MGPVRRWNQRQLERHASLPRRSSHHPEWNRHLRLDLPQLYFVFFDVVDDDLF